jgi:hypothetical protein
MRKDPNWNWKADRLPLIIDTHQLPEWYAYVPTKMDYSDLWSILAL